MVVVLVIHVAVAVARVQGVSFVVVGHGPVNLGTIVKDDSPRYDPTRRSHVEAGSSGAGHCWVQVQDGILPALTCNYNKTE